MPDYPVAGGRSSVYPVVHYGGQYTGNGVMTFCEPGDLINPGASVLAMTATPVVALSTTPVVVGEEFFGMHIQYRMNDAATGGTFKTVRSHDMKNGTGQWKSLEPSDNTWFWDNMDSWVNTHYAAGRDLVFTLFGTPTWASSDPTEVGIFGSSYLGLHAEPQDMAKWSRFCTKVATRYLGKIKYYEVWNEPNMNNNGTTTSGSSFFFSGTHAKLSEMVRLANQAIKAVDPTAKIVSPPVQGWNSVANASDTYFIGMMAASDGAAGTMKDWIDIVGVHLYPPSVNDTTKIAACIDRVNACKTTASVSGKPTWDTESAPIGGDVINLTDALAIQIISRCLITMAAKGVARTMYYQWDHGTMGIINRPAIISAWQSVRTLLMSGTLLGASKLLDGRVAYSTASGVTLI